MLLTFRKKNIKGFTLVEMMVAVTLFTFVMFIATTSLLSIIGLNKKARANQAVINNINAVLEQMMRDIRLGKDYYCDNSFASSGVKDCESGASVFTFTPSTGGTSKSVYNLGSEYKVVQLCQDCFSGGAPTPITSTDISIDNLTFYVTGTNLASKQQPFVRIYISGHAFTSSATGKPERVDFALQTSASQRLPKS